MLLVLFCLFYTVSVSGVFYYELPFLYPRFSSVRRWLVVLKREERFLSTIYIVQ